MTGTAETARKGEKEQHIFRQTWTWKDTWGLIFIVVAIGLMGLRPIQSRLISWLITLGLLGLFAVVAGRGVTGRFLGLLVDERNKMSLSRLQMILWTLLVLSGWVSAALWNVVCGADNPLAIAIPQELWLLMGISTTSLVGSPLILSTRKNKPAESGEVSDSLKKLRVDRDKIENVGLVVENKQLADAQLADLFRGEEVSNADKLDLAKIQMLYFTLMLVLVYAVTLGHMFARIDCAITTFPALNTSVVALLGISHAGYLTSKALPRSITPRQ